MKEKYFLLAFSTEMSFCQ